MNVAGGLNNSAYCKPCEEEDLTVKADGFCKECEEYMCSTCFKHHLKGRLCKHHMFVDIETSQIKTEQNVKIYVEHGDHIKFFCKKDMVVGCAECMVMRHKMCNLEYITDVAKDFKVSMEFIEMQQKLVCIDTITVENSKLIANANTRHKDSFDKARKDIKDFKQKIEENLQQAECQILECLNKKENETKILLQDLEKKNQTSQTEVENLQLMLNPEVYSETALFINAINLKQKLTNAQLTVLQVEDSANIKHFAFKPDEVLKRVVNNIKTLGTLDTTTSLSGEVDIEKEYSNGVHVLVKGVPTEGTAVLWVKLSDNIRDVKRKIHTDCGIPEDDQILVQDYLGKTLNDQLNVKEYYIHDYSTLILKVKHRQENKEKEKDKE